jgi:hypothetical protein
VGKATLLALGHNALCPFVPRWAIPV